MVKNGNFFREKNYGAATEIPKKTTGRPPKIRGFFHGGSQKPAPATASGPKNRGAATENPGLNWQQQPKISGHSPGPPKKTSGRPPKIHGVFLPSQWKGLALWGAPKGSSLGNSGAATKTCLEKGRRSWQGEIIIGCKQGGSSPGKPADQKGPWRGEMATCEIPCYKTWPIFFRFCLFFLLLFYSVFYGTNFSM